ncbi:sensor histidine kinase [Undibacterium sp. TJN25]|uniref:sensor histidine kinase n=1 Tax=Undibacterium sp. TJN25 TaxID=3413056 RepID=UPI003BF183D6
MIAANVMVLLALMSRGQGNSDALQDFIEMAMLVETISLFSLLLLCGARRLSLLYSFPGWLQRVACGAIPAAICGLLLIYFSRFDWFGNSYPHLHLGYATLICFVVGLALQHYFELRTKAFSPALGEAQLQALQARIRPHFLFNSLNAVLSMIRTEPRRAETTLEDLADLFRILMRDTRDMSTLKEEIHLCKQYLSIEKIRLGERLAVEWSVANLTESELQNSRIATLLLQPLLENAVHYGVEPSTQPACIEVDIQRKLDKIDIRIVNPYHGAVAMPGSNHMALNNIRERLRLLYDMEAGLSHGVVGDRFEVKLYFPYKK